MKNKVREYNLFGLRKMVISQIRFAVAQVQKWWNHWAKGKPKNKLIKSGIKDDQRGVN